MHNLPEKNTLESRFLWFHPVPGSIHWQAKARETALFRTVN
jgi:hypothetical protein